MVKEKILFELISAIKSHRLEYLGKFNFIFTLIANFIKPCNTPLIFGEFIIRP